MIDEKFLNDAERELGKFNASITSLKKELLPANENQTPSQPLKYYEPLSEKSNERQFNTKGESVSPFDVFEFIVGVFEVFSAWH